MNRFKRIRIIFIVAIILFINVTIAEHFSGHEQLNVTLVNHSGISNNAASNNFGATLTNTTKTAVFFTQNAGRLGSYATLYKCSLANSTLVSCVRNVSATSELEVYTAEFDSGIIVRRGNLTIGAGTQTATVDLVNSTKLSTSFIIFSNTANNSIDAEERFLFFANFTNETVMQFSRNDTLDKSDIEWQVITFTDNSTVQAGTNSIDGTTTRISVNITRVDLAKSFIVISYNASRTVANERRYGTRASFVNETQINLSRNTGNAGDRIEIAWFVVSLNHTNVSVQQINTTQTGLETNVTITEVNLSRTVVVGSSETSANGLNTYKSAVNFTNTTMFQEISDTSAPGNQRTSTWFIIQFPFTASTAAPAPSPAPTENITSGYNTFGRSINFALVTSILNKTNDTLGNTNDYAAAFDPASLFVAFVSNNAFGTRTDSKHSATEWILEVRQPLASKLFVTFTKGNEQQLQKKIDVIKNFGILDTRFGSYDIKIPEIVPVILRLEYDKIDIVGRAVMGPGSREIVVENLGKNANNVTKVKITVIR